jgi:L,D-transpeptidase catalytic domain
MAWNDLQAAARTGWTMPSGRGPRALAGFGRGVGSALASTGRGCRVLAAGVWRAGAFGARAAGRAGSTIWSRGRRSMGPRAAFPAGAEGARASRLDVWTSRVVDLGRTLRPRWAPRRLNRFQLHALQQISRRNRVLATSGLALLAVAALLPVITGRTAPRWYHVQSARLAVERAAENGADAWAAEPMRAARAMLQVALVEHRHQELRFPLLRDFSQAEALLIDTEEKATRANNLALVRQNSARNSSHEAISRAAQSLSQSMTYAAAMNLGPYDRSLLQKSRLRLQEAEILHRDSRYDLAVERARDAALFAEQVSNHAAKATARFQDASYVRSWRRWIDDTIALSRRSGSLAIIIYKEKHLLTLYQRGKPIRSYSADMGYYLADSKSRAGDLATPEGRYKVAAKKGNGESAYHLALLLDYPNEDDRQRFEAAKREGRIHRNATLGGLIEIHGEGGRGRDWTMGCVALSNADVEDLFQRVEVGTPVTIVGGDGRGGAFSRNTSARGDASAGID